jgi:hypothetical protein
MTPEEVITNGCQEEGCEEEGHEEEGCEEEEVTGFLDLARPEERSTVTSVAPHRLGARPDALARGAIVRR